MRGSLFWTAVLGVVAASAHAVSSDVPMTDGAAEGKRPAVVERYTLPPTDIAKLNPESELGDLPALSGRTNPGDNASQYPSHVWVIHLHTSLTE